MKPTLYSKTSIRATLKSLAGIGLISLAASVSAFDDTIDASPEMQPITCENGKNYADIFHEMQPFLGDNYDNTIAQLPEAQKQEILAIEAQLKVIEEQLEANEEVDEQQEAELLKLVNQLELIIQRNNIQFKEVNRLDSLSEAQKAEAIDTWCDIAEKIEQKDIEIGAMFIQLDNIIIGQN